MRKMFLLAGALFVLAAGSAEATSQGGSIRYNGVWCKSDSNTGGVLCVTTTGGAYGIGFGTDLVTVMNLHTHKMVFVRNQ